MWTKETKWDDLIKWMDRIKNEEVFLEIYYKNPMLQACRFISQSIVSGIIYDCFKCLLGNQESCICKPRYTFPSNPPDACHDLQSCWPHQRLIDKDVCYYE